MAIRASIKREYEDNFLLDEAKLRKVASILDEYAAKLKSKSYVEYYIEREDQTSYTTRNIEEVLADENAAGKRIATLLVSIEPEESGESAKVERPSPEKTVAFIGFTKLKSPRVRIGLANENRDWCFLLSDELDNQVKRLTRKRPLKFIPLKFIDGVVFVSVTIIVITFLILRLHASPAGFTTEQIAQMSQDQKLNEILRLESKKFAAQDFGNLGGAGFTLIFMFLILYRPLARAIQYLTESTFYWGDAVSHFERRERLAGNIKWVVIVGFIISVIAGLATTGLLNFWTKH